jgi:mycothiol system anti-sigma-R factor
MTDMASDGDCARVLQKLYLYIDNEMPISDCYEVRRHLEACQPCLERFQLDCQVKALVARSCCEQAPPTLRERVSMFFLQAPTSRGDLPWGQR